MMIVVGWKVIGNGHKLALFHQDATTPGAVATLSPRHGQKWEVSRQQRHGKTLHLTARRGKSGTSAFYSLGATTDLFHCVGAAQSRKREIFDEKQNADFASVRVLTAFGGCRRLRIRPGVQVDALHWPDQ
jgi:hypothetical protein